MQYSADEIIIAIADARVTITSANWSGVRIHSECSPIQASSTSTPIVIAARFIMKSPSRITNLTTSISRSPKSQLGSPQRPLAVFPLAPAEYVLRRKFLERVDPFPLIV